MIVASPPLAAVALPMVIVGALPLQIVSPVVVIAPGVNTGCTVIVPVAFTELHPPVTGIL